MKINLRLFNYAMLLRKYILCNGTRDDYAIMCHKESILNQKKEIAITFDDAYKHIQANNFIHTHYFFTNNKSNANQMYELHKSHCAVDL